VTRITQFLRPFGPDIAEAGPLEEAARAAVEDGTPLALRVVRVALDDPAAGLADQLQRAAQHDGQ
jgi:hypothetical protein